MCPMCSRTSLYALVQRYVTSVAGVDIEVPNMISAGMRVCLPNMRKNGENPVVGCVVSMAEMTQVQLPCGR